MSESITPCEVYFFWGYRFYVDELSKFEKKFKNKDKYCENIKEDCEEVDMGLDFLEPNEFGDDCDIVYIGKTLADIDILNNVHDKLITSDFSLEKTFKSIDKLFKKYDINITKLKKFYDNGPRMGIWLIQNGTPALQNCD